MCLSCAASAPACDAPSLCLAQALSSPEPLNEWVRLMAPLMNLIFLTAFSCSSGASNQHPLVLSFLFPRIHLLDRAEKNNLSFNFTLHTPFLLFSRPPSGYEVMRLSCVNARMLVLCVCSPLLPSSFVITFSKYCRDVYRKRHRQM